MKSIIVASLLLGFPMLTWAQQPPPTPTCEEQLNNEMWQAGELKKQLAIANEKLRIMAKELREAQAKIPAPKVEEKK